MDTEKEKDTATEKETDGEGEGNRDRERLYEDGSVLISAKPRHNVLKMTFDEETKNGHIYGYTSPNRMLHPLIT